MAGMYPQFRLLGDSLTQNSCENQDGFSMFGAIQSEHNRRRDVINRGMSGWTTRNMAKYIGSIIPPWSSGSPRIEILAIWLGANDATIKLPTTSQHVPIEETKENLTAIITHPNVKSHNPKIFVLLPPPVDEIKLTEVDVKNGHETATRRSEVTAKYAQAVREAADTNGVKSIDVFEAITNAAIKIAAPGEYTPGGPVLGSLENGKRGGLESLLTDGLHLSGAGYKVVFDALKRGVGEDWPKQGTEDDRSDYVYPDWRVLNPMEE